MMKKLPLLLLLSLPLVLPGCGSGEKDRSQDDPHRMFEELCALTKAYTDSMKHVADSASLISLSERYEERYAAISFKYPAGTDVRLTEGENDRLFALAKAYIKAREKALSVAPADTVPTDSLAVAPVKAEPGQKQEARIRQ